MRVLPHMQRLFPLIGSFVLVASVFFVGCKDDQKCQEGRVIVEAVRDNISNDPPGRTLILRVFCNGKAEYDNYDNSAPPKLTETVLSETELSQIADAVRDLAIEPHQTDYKPTVKSIDSFITVTLTFDTGSGPQTIVMKEADSHIHIDSLDSPALRNLMWLITIINSKRRLGISNPPEGLPPPKA